MERVNMTEEMPADDPQMENPTEETSELQQEEQATDRPEWLPDKFGNPEDLAKAYGELERKLSSRDAEEKGLLTESDFDQYQEEYDKTGLGDETYQTLEKKGFQETL